jgi:GMP synthase-like glutamine amidotransferase
LHTYEIFLHAKSEKVMARRIGILLTCVDDSEFAKRFPDDGEKFRRLLQPLRPDWKFVTVPVKDGVFPDKSTDFDGYIITGSPVSVNANSKWIKRLFGFIRELDAAKIPTFGACFGHQAIALALGGAVEKADNGWGLGVAETEYASFAPWMQPPQTRMNLFAAHEDQVTRLPDGAEVLGGSDFCPVGAYRIGSHIFATEYHPEMTLEFVRALLNELESGLDSQTIATSRTSLAMAAEGPAFARWIVNFLDKSAA